MDINKLTKSTKDLCKEKPITSLLLFMAGFLTTKVVIDAICKK